ncbi:putative ABC transporter transmembrane protein [Cellulomonas fimi]|uniref:Putative ABC transporter transmembrane protein n=1 Tax=Cellulomonas fimi (strain ATCC 484 / DSM 20113 / JCM 1341 / CCUG 24087 / LMG 16345 / NBRC 15513 / NCIMB 8980 / NCTC 7547 / NRS-133) TaxID=590998 RepID=F4H2J9_CELFA|nr:putative ABC transporter transmembrane protein [Cellulomonas fimi]AEE45225.1 putative ABC transporter transmembrane protein [Cellulomonas fimi ATCC 484]NNH07109.1 ABC transporter permease [Cellulomonas fimi]VEH28629.1 ABC-type transport system involved in multi-copper enzyme maturation, permease component [Cellulomonas fimi]
MTAAAPSATPSATRIRPRVAVQPVTFGRLVAAEWVKLRSLRSTWWTLILAVAAFAALGWLRASSIASIAQDVPDGALVGPVYATSGLLVAQLALSGLAVVAVTAEYRTGQIRSTLAAAPARVPALVAKLVVVLGAVLVAGLAGAAAGWAGAAPSFARAGMTVDLADPEHLRLMLGVPLYLVAMAALAFGIGATLRSSAAGIATVMGLVFVVEPAFARIPWEPLQQLAALLPSAAGSRLVTSDTMGSVTSGSQSVTLGPWEGFGVLVAWAVTSVVVAAVLLRRRDA